VLIFSEVVRGLACDLALIYARRWRCGTMGVAISERSWPSAAAS